MTTANATNAAAATVSRQEARDLLESMVATPSVSGDEREACELLVDFFADHGREAWLDDVGNVRAPADDSVLLTSHVDTVPGEIPVRVEEGDDGPALWGRGSVDATGPLVAMAVAAVETGVSFVGVVGEETDSRGARHLVTDREAPDAVINGEPSGWDGITLGYRGLVAGRYVATSESGHTSRPENNAIQDALQWWSRVEAAFAPEEGEESTMAVQLRVPPSLTTDEVRERVERELDGGTVRWHDAVPPVMTSPRTEVARAFRVAIRDAGGDPRLLRKTGTADVNLYAEAWDCPMATYGPGDSALDHAPDERLSLAEFDRSVTVLESVARTLGGESA
jgi:LysW-gamma-L-lysine carboxypeptidase